MLFLSFVRVGWSVLRPLLLVLNPKESVLDLLRALTHLHRCLSTLDLSDLLGLIALSDGYPVEVLEVILLLLVVKVVAHVVHTTVMALVLREARVLERLIGCFHVS
jgi:hypothetical protein